MIHGNTNDNSVAQSIPHHAVELENLMDASTIVNGMHGTTTTTNHGVVGQTNPSHTKEPVDAMNVNANEDDINGSSNDGVVVGLGNPRLCCGGWSKRKKQTRIAQEVFAKFDAPALVTQAI